MVAVGVGLAVLLFVLSSPHTGGLAGGNWLSSATRGVGLVFRNPQPILCGIIAGLMFIPTTIFDMVWGVRYLQDALGLERVFPQAFPFAGYVQVSPVARVATFTAS